jgi:hypothetical protein
MTLGIRGWRVFNNKAMRAFEPKSEEVTTRGRKLLNLEFNNFYRDSIFGIVIGYGLDDRGVEVESR